MPGKRPARRRQRVVRAVQETPQVALEAPATPVEEATVAPTRPTTLLPQRRDVRPLVFGAVVGFVVLVVLILAGGGAGAPPALPQEQPPPDQVADAVFAGIDRSDIPALMRRGKELYDQNRFEDAARVYQEVIRLNPDNQAAHSNLGSSYFRMQRIDEALTYFREAVRLNPNDAEARQNLGAGLAAVGDFDAAISEYLQAVSLKPDLAPARYSLGVLYQEKGNKEKAIEELKRYLEIGTDEQLRGDAERRLQSLGAR